MTDKPSFKSSENTPTDVRIIKASFALKIKVGSGGFDPRNVQKAEKSLAMSTHLFPSVASQDIELIKQTLREFQQSNTSSNSVRTILGAAAELRSHSTMFQFPLVSKVAESLLEFCEKVNEMSPLVEEIVLLHLRTLQIAMDEGPRAINGNDRVELLSGLEKACEKALKGE